jgi:hypothetical protein
MAQNIGLDKSATSRHRQDAANQMAKRAEGGTYPLALRMPHRLEKKGKQETPGSTRFVSFINFSRKHQ